MKRMLIGVILLVALSGCTARSGKATSSAGSLPDGPVAFEVLTRSAWPTDVADWAAQATRNQGGPVHAARTFGDKTYVLIFGGVLPSEGYTITFAKIEAAGGTVTVTAAVEGPSKPWSSRVELPMAVARFARHGGPVEFRVDQKREK